jgi:hypothetical protein
MRSFLFACVVVALAACNDQPTTSDILKISVQQFQLNVGGSTVMEAQLVDPTTNAVMTVDASWTVDPPSGVVTLTQQGEVEQVTAVGAGSAIVTASVDQKTQKVEFTVNP